MRHFLEKAMNKNAKQIIYPVYILARVVTEIFDQCKQTIPDESLGRLLGYRCAWQGTEYTKITDWVTATIDNGHAHAFFTQAGIQECELLVDERYGKSGQRPVEIGIFHSHPFGVEPYFSSIDKETFLSFPYDREGNVFILIDPVSLFFKVFIVSGRKDKELRQISWICYTPKISNSL